MTKTNCPEELQWILTAKDEEVQDGVLLAEPYRSQFLSEVGDYYEPNEWECKELAGKVGEVQDLKKELKSLKKIQIAVTDANMKLCDDLTKLENQTLWDFLKSRLTDK